MIQRKILLFFGFFIITIIAKSQTCPSIKDAAGNGAINVNCSYNLDSNNCFPLNITFNNENGTNDYNLSAISYPSTLNFTTGNKLEYKDNEYLERINFNDGSLFGSIPFSFSFYGKPRNSFIVSSNGFITFDESYTQGDFSTKEITGRKIPSSYLPPASIFGIYQDLDFSHRENGVYTGNVNYRVEGKAPCRRITINFYNGNIFGSNQFSTSQIVLYEQNNDIDVYVENKPLPNSTVSMKESLLGIIDEDGNGITPTSPDRNTGIWAANKEAYRFSPKGANVKPSKIVWTGSSSPTFPFTTLNSNFSSVTVCPKSQETIIATATYDFPDGETFTKSDDIVINFDQTYPLVKDFVKVLCDNSVTTFSQSQINPDLLVDNPNITNFVFKYYLDPNDANLGTSNYLLPTDLLDITKTYYVRVENSTNPNCFRVAKLTFSLVNNLILTNTVDVCDYNLDGLNIEKNFVLSKLNCQIFSPEITGTKKYYIGTSSTPVTTANLTPATKIFVKFTYGTCNEVTYGPISVNFNTGPAVINGVSFTSVNQICDIITSGNPQFTEPFNWEAELNSRGIKFSSDSNVAKVSVFAKETDARDNKNALKVITEGSPALGYTYNLYARLEYATTNSCKGACFSVVKFTAKVFFNRIILNVTDGDTDTVPDSPTIYDNEDADIYLCERNQPENINLHNDANSVIKVMYPTTGVTTPTFHTNYNSANDLSNIAGDYPTYDVVLADNVITKTFYVRYMLGTDCYVVKKLIYHILDPIADKKFIEICTSNGSTSENITLSDYDKTILGTAQWNQTPRPTVTYYNYDQTSIITTLDVTKTPTTIWALINSSLAGSCSKKHPIEFKLTEIGGVKTDKIEVNLNCDHFNDNLEKIVLTDFYPQIFSGNLADYDLKWYKSYNNATSTFSGLISNPSTPITITKNISYYLKISQPGNTTCVRKVELKFIVNFSTYSPLTLDESTTFLRCNKSGVQSHFFDLRKAIPLLYDGNGNPPRDTYLAEVKFFKNKTDAENLTSTNFLSDAEAQNYEHFSTSPTETLYARFKTINGCYFMAEVIIKIIDKIKFNVINDVEVCDDNLDGDYKFDLRAWLNEINNDANPFNDIVTDPEIAKYVTYSFYDNGILLTPEQETNYTINKITKKVTIKADIEGDCNEFTTLGFILKTYNSYNRSISDKCDLGNDGKEEINLTQFQNQFSAAKDFEYYKSLSDLYVGSSLKIANPNKYPFDKKDGNQLYAKIIYQNACPDLLEITVNLKETPIFSIDNFYVCPKEKYPLIQPNYNGYTIISYDWRDAANNQVSPINSSSASNLPAGKYTLKVVSINNCDYTASFEILEKEVPIITKVFAEGNTFTITATGSKKILYSTDLVNWQESNVFNNLPKGVVTFYVKFEGEDCIGATKQSVVFEFPNSFTPNGDGINDTWEILDADVFGQEMPELRIYDRFGNVVYQQLNGGRLFWDGTSFGRKLSTDTYWYYLKLPDGRIFRGWVLLKNRE